MTKIQIKRREKVHSGAPGRCTFLEHFHLNAPNYHEHLQVLNDLLFSFVLFSYFIKSVVPLQLLETCAEILSAFHCKNQAGYSFGIASGLAPTHCLDIAV